MSQGAGVSHACTCIGGQMQTTLYYGVCVCVWDCVTVGTHTRSSSFAQTSAWLMLSCLDLKTLMHVVPKSPELCQVQLSIHITCFPTCATRHQRADCHVTYMSNATMHQTVE